MANLGEFRPLLKHPDGLEQAALQPQAEAPPARLVVAPKPQEKASSSAATRMEPPFESIASSSKPREKAPGPPPVKGLPALPGSVIGVPVGRAQWSSGILDCLGRNDEFCSSDVEVCLLGSFAPCVLYGSNAERLGEIPGSFAENCFPYTGLFVAGYVLFGWNCLVPWYAHRNRTAVRRKFNLENTEFTVEKMKRAMNLYGLDGKSNESRWNTGSFEAFSRSVGCFNGVVEDETRREQLEQLLDLAAHYMCHTCSLCQEGRELRRRLPHPGFNVPSVLVMMPPADQTMGRGA